MRAYWLSLREWVLLVVKTWWFSIPGVVAGLLWIAALDGHRVVVSREWAVRVGVAVLLAASFGAFHKVRVQRDAKSPDAERRMAFRVLLAPLRTTFEGMSKYETTDADREAARRTRALIGAALGKPEADRFWDAVWSPDGRVRGERAVPLLEELVHRPDVRADFDSESFALDGSGAK